MRKQKTPDRPDCLPFIADPVLINVPQGQARYGLSRPSVMKLAEEHDAVVRIGRTVRINVKKLDAAL